MVFHLPECTAFAINLELRREKRKMSWDVNKRASKLLQVPLQGLTSNI